jgi:dimethylhistidine N-methyltransferase
MRARAVRFHDALPSVSDWQDEVLRGLATRPRHIAPKFFYDERGSRLFDDICRLPEYYLTRTETAILRERADDIAALAGPDCTLIELGSGASEKVRLLLDHLRPRQYVGVDISRDFLLHATEQLARDYPWLEVHAACADFAHDLDLQLGPSAARRLAFFPGSTVGNFEPHDALAFLTRVRQLLRPDGALLIGVDLKKDPAVLHRAYNDAAGVTAAFNLNLLQRLRAELDAELDVDGFRHLAFYNAPLGRIEMHLVARGAQSIRVLGRRFHLVDGERIHTENSYKYSVEEFHALARRAGLAPLRVWTDSERLFSVHCLGVLLRTLPCSA